MFLALMMDMVLYVGMTIQHLEKSSRRRRVTALLSSMATPGIDDRHLDDVCTICYGGWQQSQQQQSSLLSLLSLPKSDKRRAVLTPCGHVYHCQYLRVWIDFRLNCPMCRTKFRLKDDWYCRFVRSMTQ